LSEAGQVPKGWEEALPKVANNSQARLPKNLSKEQIEALHATCPERIFEPLRPPFTAERSYTHVLNSIRYVFGLAGIHDRGSHSLRHTAATKMVNAGASFKDVADVLGHKSITTTFIYATHTRGSSDGP
jgi:integrase